MFVLGVHILTPHQAEDILFGVVLVLILLVALGLIIRALRNSRSSDGQD